jgi:hypothetical protein
VGDIQSAMTGTYSHISCPSHLICLATQRWITENSYNSVPRNDGPCFWPRLSVVLVCVELWVCPPRLQKARSHTVGCAVAQPINPLKLGQTLSTLNFRSCEQPSKIHFFSFLFFFVSFRTSFLVTLRSIMLFAEFLRLPTRVEEASS